MPTKGATNYISDYSRKGVLEQGVAGKQRTGAERTRRKFINRQRVTAQAPLEATYAAVASIGGENGWYYANWLWRLRGAMDELLGGVGCRRGRSRAGRSEPGDVLDCWRVETHEPNAHLRLRAEMKVWGDAWLDFRVESAAGSRSTLTQTAEYVPTGWFGYVYWIAVYPVHAIIFRGMAKAVARQAEVLSSHEEQRADEELAGLVRPQSNTE